MTFLYLNNYVRFCNNNNMFTGVLHIDHKSQPSFTNSRTVLPHGVGLAAILTSACGLHLMPVSRSGAQCRLAEP